MAISNRNITMDFIRGISAVLVCGGHLRAAMFVDFNGLEQSSILNKTFYFITSLGHEAVMVFFVLSGFFVGGSVLSKRLKFKFDGYLIARLSRLWTVLIPALVFTFLMDLITIHFYPSVLAGDYYSVLISGPKSATYSASLETFFANITFLQSVYSPVYGSNGPLWSLTYEFWYYIAFPLLTIIFGVVKMSNVKKVIAALILFVITYYFAAHLLLGFIIWMLGVAVYLIYSKDLLKLGYWFTFTSFFIFIASLAYSKAPLSIPGFLHHTDLVVGLAFMLFLISLRNIEKQAWVDKYLSKFSFWLSDLSYTLYVIHFPVLMLLYGHFYKNEQEVLSPTTFIVFLGWLVALIILSRGFWYVFERNTPIIRNLMFKFRYLFSKRS